MNNLICAALPRSLSARSVEMVDGSAARYIELPASPSLVPIDGSSPPQVPRPRSLWSMGSTGLMEETPSRYNDLHRSQSVRTMEGSTSRYNDLSQSNPPGDRAINIDRLVGMGFSREQVNIINSIILLIVVLYYNQVSIALINSGDDFQRALDLLLEQ